MIGKDIALGTWENNLLDKETRELLCANEMFSYIDTAINYNNDYLLSNVNKKIISKISACHLSEYEFFVSNHLKCLNREKIDIMLIHSSRGCWKDLAILMKDDKRFIEIGVSNFNKTEIEEFESITGYYPKYNEVEINPLYTDVETINFCKSKGIKVIAYGIVGGKYLAQKMVAIHSLPYILLYAQHYADILILKPESIRHLQEYEDCLNNLNVNVSVNYVPVHENASMSAINKQIVPMRYVPPTIKKTLYGEPTYHICCGKNTCKNFSLKRIRKFIDIPTFEMLGDYQTYIRYKYRQTYDKGSVYDYDFLIGDDGHFYVVYLYDENENLTKVNEGRVEVYKYEKYKSF